MDDEGAEPEEEAQAYESGPFCRHWGDPSCCVEPCEVCGVCCHLHDDVCAWGLKGDLVEKEFKEQALAEGEEWVKEGSCPECGRPIKIILRGEGDKVGVKAAHLSPTCSWWETASTERVANSLGIYYPQPE